MSGRSSFSAAFLGGLLGSNRGLQRWLFRWARHVAVTVLLLPAFVMIRLGVPAWWAVRITAWLWLVVLVWALVCQVTPWLLGKSEARTQRKAARRERIDRPERLDLTLYVYLEPDDLPDGMVCYCGKPRVAGEVVYVGKTIRGIEQRTVEHQDDKHWMQPELEIHARMDFADENALAQAERDAYDRMRPRENAVRPSAFTSRRHVV